MAISSGIAIKFKEDCLEGVHDFTSATFKIALYTSIASLSNGTSVFLVSGELASGNEHPVVIVSLNRSTKLVDLWSANGCGLPFLRLKR